MTLARRIADHFVAPAQERPALQDAEPRALPRSDRGLAATTRRPPPAVAVLAPPADAPALAAALGLALARAYRTPIAVLCVWSAQPVRAWRAPPLPAAARMAATLTGRGHDATAAGRLVAVRLAAAPDEAAAQALRVGAAAGVAPVLFALAGPRAAAFDELLVLQDLVVVAVAPGADPALARLATAGLERTVTCDVPPAEPGRILAAAGLALLPSMRRAVAAPVAALS